MQFQNCEDATFDWSLWKLWSALYSRDPRYPPKVLFCHIPVEMAGILEEDKRENSATDVSSSMTVQLVVALGT